MRCTVCRSPTSVDRTRRVDRDRRVVRDRVCKADATHTFSTREEPIGLNLDSVLVRRSGDGALAEGGFDRARLVRDVRKGVLKRMTDDEVVEVVRQATLDLEMELASLVTPLKPQELRERPGHTLAISDVAIREAIEKRLREQDKRMPHVLYALSTLGRSDREGRLGFVDASQVLRWMGEKVNYADLATQDLPPPIPMPTDLWWPPQPSPPLPERVIKRSNERRQFGLGVFQRSILEAMAGRPNAAVVSENVAQWALWGFAGQREVLTAQLAVGVMDCLRRVDDIAYLRWTAISKNIESVTAFRDEALALITHPSPRLSFDVAGKARPRPNRADHHAS